MARLHLKFREDAFDPHLLELTERFFLERKKSSRQKTGRTHAALFDTWLHGACLVYELPFPGLTMDPKAPTPDNMHPMAGYYNPEGAGTIVLRRWSAISLFHQFRHHHQRYSDEKRGGNWNHAQHGADAQAWACSLFYKVNPRLFRKWVRLDRVAGVHPEDLLRRRRA